MSERKIPPTGAAAVASVQIGQIDPSVRRGDFGISEVKLGLSSGNGYQIATPRVATRNGVDRKIAMHCGVSDKSVAAQRAKASGGIRQIDTPRVATRNGVEYEIRTAGINANRRPDPREEAAKCVGGTLHI